ncbi:helix-turn-helix domain-containing protein [Lysinibacillus odysseyi]|uniref:helix-turn-helix domain-containing protein n=1 Tax=Lysinibacillus odysseyi TaxID=202611 RepID=UPI0009DD9596|nr:helix-turn-helix domain-containing protein [Lysinibacillus odysseyi]
MAAFDYLEQYSTFETVAAMDVAVEQHIQQHYFDLTESERAIVFMLASRSLLHPGASHLKAETIADQVGVSTKTVYRSIKKLAELGIIEKVPGTKLNGIKGASIYRILPYVPSGVSQRVTAHKASSSKDQAPKSENQPSISFNQNLKDHNTYAPQASAEENVDNLLVTKEQTSYQRMKTFIANFIDDKKLTYKIYGIWLAQTKRCINVPDIDIAIDAIKYTMQAVKTNRVRSVTGYFNNTLSNLLDKYYERSVEDIYTEMEKCQGPEWLFW